MNGSIIRKILGYVLVLEGVLLLMPGLVGLYYHEEEYKTYLICAAVTFAIGAVVAFKKTKNKVYLGMNWAQENQVIPLDEAMISGLCFLCLVLFRLF